MLFVIKSLFVFLFTQYPKQMQTLHNALNVVQIGEEKGKNRLFFFSECQIWDYWINIYSRELPIG